jgi:predicted P-loop ATPase
LPDEKDCKLMLLSTWIWEISEWGNTARKADREALKSFITTVKVQERAAYGRYKTEGQAMSSFMATTNNENGLLNDPTGNTRFMIAKVEKIDWKGYSRNIDIDQVWAQAMALYIGGEPWELDPAEFAIATDINNNYLTIDIVEETIKSLFHIQPGGMDFMGTLEIMNELKGIGNLKPGIEIDTRRMASALTRLGLDKPRPGVATNRGKRGYYGIRRLP